MDDNIYRECLDFILAYAMSGSGTRDYSGSDYEEPAKILAKKLAGFYQCGYESGWEDAKRKEEAL